MYQPQYAPPAPAPQPPVQQVVVQEEAPKKNKFGKLGNTMAQSAAGGVGFGAGEFPCPLALSWQGSDDTFCQRGGYRRWHCPRHLLRWFTGMAMFHTFYFYLLPHGPWPRLCRIFIPWNDFLSVSIDAIHGCEVSLRSWSYQHQQLRLPHTFTPSYTHLGHGLVLVCNRDIKEPFYILNRGSIPRVLVHCQRRVTLQLEMRTFVISSLIFTAGLPSTDESLMTIFRALLLSAPLLDFFLKSFVNEVPMPKEPARGINQRCPFRRGMKGADS